MNKKTILNRIFSSTYSYSFFSKGIHIVLGLVGTIIINRFLGTELKGEYAYIVNIITILFTIFNLGIYQSYPFNKRKKLENIKFLYTNLIIKQFILYIIITIIGLYCAYILNFIDRNSITVFVISDIFLLLNILSHQLSMITSIESFKDRTKAFVTAEVIQFILLVLMYVLYDKNIYYVLVINIIYHFVYSIVCLIKLNVKIDLKYKNREFMIETIKMGFFPTLFTLFLSLNYRLDIIFLRQYVGINNITMSDVGLYSVGVQLAQYVWLIPDIFKEVLFNKTAKNDSTNEIMYCMKISLAISTLALIIVLIFGNKLIVLLYGNEYEGAIDITKIIFIGVISMCIFKILNPLYNAKGKFFENFIILCVSIIINVIFNFILIPTMGTIGAAIASVFGYVICSVVYLLRFKKEYKIPIKKMLIFNKKDCLNLKELLTNRNDVRK